MNEVDIRAVLALLGNRAWVPGLTAFILIVIRLSKTDPGVAFWKVAIAPKWRPWFALGIGIVGAAVHELATGGTWTAALLGGLTVGGFAITTHELVIESLRNGRDIGIPKIPLAPGTIPPPSPKAISLKPPAMPPPRPLPVPFIDADPDPEPPTTITLVDPPPPRKKS